MTMTPGTYLRLRRQAAGLSLDDVALRTDTYPQVPARRRAEQLADIEADRVTVRPGEAIALARAFMFDGLILDRLIAVHAGETQAYTAPPICEACGCSWMDACVDLKRKTTCSWTDDDADLCSVCAAKDEAPQPVSAAA